MIHWFGFVLYIIAGTVIYMTSGNFIELLYSSLWVHGGDDPRSKRKLICWWFVPVDFSFQATAAILLQIFIAFEFII